MKSGHSAFAFGIPLLQLSIPLLSWCLGLENGMIPIPLLGLGTGGVPRKPLSTYSFGQTIHPPNLFSGLRPEICHITYFLETNTNRVVDGRNLYKQVG